MTDIFSLEGRVALVTGASRGLGVAMAEALASRGAIVVLNGRDPETLRAVAAKISRRREIAAFDVCDAKAGPDSDRRHRQATWQARHPRQQCRHPASPPAASNGKTAISSVYSPPISHRAFVWRARRRGSWFPRKYGRIINTGSVAGILARPTIHGYVAAKSGLHGLTKSMAAEIGRHGVTGQCDCAGLFRNRTQPRARLRTRNSPPGSKGARRRAAGPSRKNLGGAVIFLASDAASYVNGHVLAVDGGISVSL